MGSDPIDQSDEIEARATAFVFGELDREEATEFMKQMAASNELQAIVASIRDTVGTLQDEFCKSTPKVNANDRRRIESAMNTVSPQPPPIVPDASDASRRWAISLAVAATLLLACGLTLPALNRAITASNDTTKLREQIRQIELENKRLFAEKQTVEKELAAWKMNRAVEIADETVANVSDDHTGTEDLAEQQSVEMRLPGAAPVGAADQTHSTEQSDDAVDLGGQPGTSPNATPGESAEMFANEPADESETPAVAEVVRESDSAERRQPLAGAAGGREESGVQRGIQSDPDSGSSTADMSIDLADSSNSHTDYESDELLGMDATRGKGGYPSMPSPSSSSPAKSGRPRAVTTNEIDQMGMGGMEMGMGGMGMEGMEMMAGGSRPTDIGRGKSDATAAFETGGYGSSGNIASKPSPSGDRFAPIRDRSFQSVTRSPLSTFSIDVDSASYSKVRMNLIDRQRLPDPDAVRIEELVNYFSYNYQQPQDDRPFGAAIKVANCPWNPKHRLARIGIKGKVIGEERPASNLVFLLDVSGSMKPANKLPLVIDGMKMLVNQLDKSDSVAIVVYAGAAGVVLDSTAGDRKKVIVDSLDRLRAGGSTNGGKGIQLAYGIARDHFIDGGTNRVILCSDGDFNVGVTDTDQLVKMAAQNARDDIFLTVLGFGMGNHNDKMMEQISNQGNGNYAFIDNRDEARKVLVEQMEGTLVTIAKDVKIQVEFNPMEVETYRLIGYENRILADKDFNDDRIDAGEIGAGHTVTALYEIVPKRNRETELADDPRKPIDDLKYQRQIRFSEAAESGEMLTVKMSYKEPTADQSTRIEFSITDVGDRFHETDRDFQFAAAVAAFGMLLRDSPHKGNSNYEMVEEIATAGAVDDRSGYRDEFVSLVKRARLLAHR